MKATISTPTRKQYLAKTVTHAEFYESVAEMAGIDYRNSDMLPEIVKAVADGDIHLNSIMLQRWDIRAAMTQVEVANALVEHEDFYSLAGGVCTHKAAAMKAYRDYMSNIHPDQYGGK